MMSSYLKNPYPICFYFAKYYTTRMLLFTAYLFRWNKTEAVNIIPVMLGQTYWKTRPHRALYGAHRKNDQDLSVFFKLTKTHIGSAISRDYYIWLESENFEFHDIIGTKYRRISVLTQSLAKDESFMNSLYRPY